MRLGKFYHGASCLILSVLGGVSAFADDYLNVDYTTPYTAWYVPKVGKAAVGGSDTDFWNAYSNLHPTGAMPNLKWADQTASGVNLQVKGGGGAWGVPTPDAMFAVYHYGGDTIESEFENLPEGSYEVYTYAHGEPDRENANIEVLVGGLSQGTKLTSSEPGWLEPLWTEGKQYVSFKGIQVSAGSKLVVKAMGAASQAVINGIQIVRKTGPVTPPPSYKYVNVDFTAPYTSWYIPKVGKAAVGASENDFWNAYSNLSQTRSLENLKWSDSNESGIRFTVSGGGGAWGVVTPDQMFAVYHYGGTIEAEFANVPDGIYDVYTYAHGEPDHENSNIELVVGGEFIGSQKTSSEPGWKTPLWTEGKQYVVFRDVNVSSEANLLVRSKADASQAVINGIQLVQKKSNVVPFPVGSLLNIDFGAHTNPSFTNKIGLAATGISTNDVWNLYSRDGTNGIFLDSNSLTNMLLSTGAASPVDLLVENAAGAWLATSTDAMMQSYLYPISRSGKIKATITSLKPGYYDLYVYAHGDPAVENAKIQVIGLADYGIKATSSSSDWNPETWVEGKQYVLFRDIQVSSTGELVVYSENGASDIAVINGLQLFFRGETPSAPVGPTIVSQPTDVEVVAGKSASFLVTVSGTSPFGFQWFHGTNVIEGATTAQLTLTNVTLGMGGAYSVTITNAAGSVTSREAQLVVSELQLPPVITHHPATQSILVGTTWATGVEIESNPSATYQWYFENQPIEGKTSPTLEIPNAQLVNAGHYHVVVSNAAGRAESKKARLFFYNEVTAPLLNVDYTAHLNATFSRKSGPAAIGKGQSDIWNIWSRDTGDGGWQSDAEVTNLRWSDNSLSNVRLAVTNAAGAWVTGNIDPMFQSYLYPLGRNGTIESVFSNLPKGTYDILVYAHGEPNEENAEIQVTTGNRTAPARSTSSLSGWDIGNWTEGNQYVRFPDIGLNEGETLRISAAGGEAGLAVINGIQLILKNGVVAPFNPLIADWTFEEGAPGEPVMKILDHSQNDHDSVQILGSPTFTVSETDAEGYVSISLPPGDVFGSGFRAADHIDFNLGNEFTLEAIINPGSSNNVANRGVVVGQNALTGQLAYGIDYRGETGTANFLIVNSSGQSTNVDAVIPQDGKSHHVAGVFVNQTLSIYVDKALVKSLTTDLTVGIPQGAKGRVTVGANDIGGYWFHGVIDRVRISRKGLTPTEFVPHKAADGQFMIVKQPRSQTVTEGDALQLTVSVAGTGEISYQWSKDNTLLEGKTSATLDISPAALTDSGTYTVSVKSTNDLTLVSAPAIVLVQAPAAPEIVTQPANASVFAGADITLNVEATGTKPLTYQWFYQNDSIAGATSSSLTLTNIQPSQAGNYSVIVSNRVGHVQSNPANVTVDVPDLTAPVIVLTSPATNETTQATITLAGKITDNVAVANAHWWRNQSQMGRLSLDSEGNFSVQVTLARGLNRLRISAMDKAGNVSVLETNITLLGSRALALITPPPAQEGTTVSLPIVLTSKGDVAAVTFQITFDGNAFAEPVIEWDQAVTGSFTQFNMERTNRIRAAFALPGVALPEGKQTIGTLKMRVRSNPSPRTTEIAMNVVGVYSATGDPITAGTDSIGTSVSLLHRKYVGDNNGNDRLDTGDATVIMRYVTLIEPRRSWDVANNDLNLNNELDSGDIIRVLRAVVGLDPQPGAVQPTTERGLLARQTVRANALGASIALVADKTDAKPGETVTVKLVLSGNEQQLAGASYKLDYPANALQLLNRESHKTGSLIPSTGTTVLWNVSPAANNYTTQDGTLRMAASAPSVWPSSNGEIAEFTFVVQPGAAELYQIPITASEAEVTSGYESQMLNPATFAVFGRQPLPAQFAPGATLNANGEFSFTIHGEPTARYRIETSSNLKDWNLLSEVVVESTGSIEVKDTQAAQDGGRFYRAILVQ